MKKLVVLILILILSLVTIIVTGESYVGPEDKVQKEKKRIVLHSQTDLLSVITDLSNQVKVLTNNLSALNSDLAKQEAQIAALTNENMKLQSRNGGGSTYVRWGRKSCPTVNGTTLVYSGYAGGSLYKDPGAAANHICLSPDPIWDHYTDAVDSLARVYGVEYEFFTGHGSDIPRHSAFFGKNLIDQDVPCSVCESPRTKVLMIPGRNSCYTGWTLEYKGYLVAGDFGHASATEYICLDKDPEFNVGGHNNDNGALLYFVEAVCGSLECPPYTNGRELTCAVCSK